MQRSRIFSVIIGAVFLLVLGGVVVMALGSGNTTTTTASSPQQAATSTAQFDPQLNACAGSADTAAPGVLSLAGDCLGSGEEVSLATLAAGRPVIVNVWAFWCGPCREEMPVLQEFAARHGDEVAVVGIHADVSTARGIGFATELGIDFPLIADTSGAYLAALEVPKVIPLTVMISADGEIAQVLARPVTSLDDLTSQVNAALGLSLTSTP